MQKIDDNYLAGFVDGEGMFYIGIVPSKETKSRWQVIYFFKVSQNPNGKYVLEYLKKRLQAGYIKPNSKSDPTDKSLAFVVRDLSNLKNKVIPFFEGRLIVKYKTFEKFKMVISLVSEKKHFTKKGIKEILDIAYSMNTKRRRVSKSEILRAYD